MDIEETLVSIVDDDESVRESLPDLVRELGFPALAFASAGDFLVSGVANETKCLILDIAMPGMSGPELWRELARAGYAIPVIFVTGQAESDLRSRLLHQGASECLFKPFSDTDLREALDAALRPG